MSLLAVALGARAVPQQAPTAAAGAVADTPLIPVPTVAELSLTPSNGQLIGENRGSAALWQTLKQLHTWASVMTIVAHPDDEDGGMLAYEARGIGARTAIMTLTRGEGGQNAMSGETFDALGLVRTNELLNADSYYAGSGITQYFGRVADYGFSKTMEEALQQWGHDRVLYDAVRVVRMERPLVVTSTFVGGITDGHGHHQVAGLLAQEVFKYAADPAYYPDQIAAGLRPWQPLKVYARLPFFPISSKGMFDYATGKWAPVLFQNYVDGTEIHGAPSANVKVPAGTYDPVLGETYVQIARNGLGQQRSQHEGPYIPLPGEVSSSYHRYGAAAGLKVKDDEASFYEGIDTSLPGLATLAHGDAPFLRPALMAINEKVNSALLNYIPASPEKIAPALHDGYKLTAALMEQVKASGLSAEDKYNLDFELGRKLQQFEDALANALGLEVAAYALPETPKANAGLPLTVDEAARVMVPGSEVSVRVHVASALGVRLTKSSLSTPEGEHWNVTRMGAPGLDGASTKEDAAVSGDVLFKVAAPQDAAPTAPYFSRPSIAQPFYGLDDARWLNHPFAPYPVTAEMEFDYAGVPIRLRSVVQSMQPAKELASGLGAVFEPLMVAPALSLTLEGHAGILPLATQSALTLPVTLRSNESGSTEGDLRLELPAGWNCEPASTHFKIAQGVTQSFSFSVRPPVGAIGQKSYTLKAIAESGNRSYSSGYVTTGYSGLRPYNLYTPATYTVTGADVAIAPALRVGYVMGTGDETPHALAEMGVSPHMLSAGELLTGELKNYDTIVIGIRAYSARPELATANARLLNFVHNGGTLVVQYQGGEYDRNYGPFPYTLGGSPERVVDEKDAVTILDAKDPLLNFPNHIGTADFDNWVEERGHSFMQSWSPQYKALTETHDAGEDPQKGGLLYAKYGSGTYIYVAFALYRQTPEAVPGAFRILANLVSAGKAGAR